MRLLIKLVLVLGVLSGLGYFGYVRGMEWLKEHNRPVFRTAAVEQGDMRITVNATGQVKPVLSVQIGSFVSGPIEDLFVDFNEEVKAGQVLATIDPRLYDAAVMRDQAALQTRKAEVERVKAELQRARNDEQRSLSLKEENEDFISQTELDQFRFSRMALEAQLLVADASIKQAQAGLDTSLANLAYTKITSPVDGVVIDRKIDPGQTLAAQFQTPELFIVAPRMREEMHIFASIDEADIGLILEAKESNQPVEFSVDAYPGLVFDKGTIQQVRLSSTTTQNVVTYPVVVSTPNQDMKLLPGMTASLTFQIRELKNVRKVPNAALRYFPDKAHVHPDDLDRLDLNLTQEPDDANKATSADEVPVDAAAEAAQKAANRIVWKADGDKLRAVDVAVGVSDYRFTEISGSDLKAGDLIVVGVKAATGL